MSKIKVVTVFLILCFMHDIRSMDDSDSPYVFNIEESLKLLEKQLRTLKKESAAVFQNLKKHPDKGSFDSMNIVSEIGQIQESISRVEFYQIPMQREIILLLDKEIDWSRKIPALR